MHPRTVPAVPAARTALAGAAGAAVALLALGAAPPAGAVTAPGLDAEYGRELLAGAERLSLTPAAGGPGTHLTVTAGCEPAGSAVSQALREPVGLQEDGSGTWVGSGQIEGGDLTVGRSYRMLVTCADGTLETGEFTLTATPSGEAGTAADSAVERTDHVTPLAVGGGLAVAAVAGYVCVARRRSTRRRWRSGRWSWGRS